LQQRQLAQHLHRAFGDENAHRTDTFTDMTASIETHTFAERVRLKELRVAHRDLDSTILELAKNPIADQIRVKRLKKRKLALRDMIVKLESALIPNLNA
jgi:hypothetical protein